MMNQVQILTVAKIFEQIRRSVEAKIEDILYYQIRKINTNGTHTKTF